LTELVRRRAQLLELLVAQRQQVQALTLPWLGRQAHTRCAGSASERCSPRWAAQRRNGPWAEDKRSSVVGAHAGAWQKRGSAASRRHWTDCVGATPRRVGGGL